MSLNPYGSSVQTPSIPPIEPNTPPARKITPGLANLCFFLAVLVFLALSYVAQKSKWGIYLTEIIGEGSLALIAIVFCGLGRFNFKETFSLRRLDWFTIFLCALAGLAGQFAVRFPAALNQWVMQIFGPFNFDLLPTPSDTPGRILLLLIVVGLAPLCEEVLNRGVVLAGYRQLGFGRTIFFVGLLFGLFHLYPFRFAYTFLLGMVLAYLVLTTGSILSSISCHFGFNLLGGLSPWLLDWLSNVLKDNGRSLLDDNSVLNFQSVVLTIPVSLFAAGVFILLLRGITRRMARQRPELELNYFGLTRNIRPANEGSAQSGPFYGPNRLYTYGRYGFARNETVHYNFPAYNAEGWAATEWATREPTRRMLPPQVRSRWLLSFVPIILLYLFTSFSEIAVRLNPDKAANTSSTVRQLELGIVPTIRLVMWWENQ